MKQNSDDLKWDENEYILVANSYKNPIYLHKIHIDDKESNKLINNNNNLEYNYEKQNEDIEFQHNNEMNNNNLSSVSPRHVLAYYLPHYIDKVLSCSDFFLQDNSKLKTYETLKFELRFLKHLLICSFRDSSRFKIKYVADIDTKATKSFLNIVNTIKLIDPLFTNSHVLQLVQTILFYCSIFCTTSVGPLIRVL